MGLQAKIPLPKAIFNGFLPVTVRVLNSYELKMPYDIVVAADFADLECEASAKSVTGTRYE